MAADPPVVFGLGRVDGSRPGRIGYEMCQFDADPGAVRFPKALRPGLHSIDEGTYIEAAERLRAADDRPRGRRDWQVSVHLPIEAATAAEAVREFWTYVEGLGPKELPTLVHYGGDELSTQAYVNGRPVDLGPP